MDSTATLGSATDDGPEGSNAGEGFVTGDTGADTTVGEPTTGDDPPGTTDGGGSALEISDGPTFDYGGVPLGVERMHEFTVTNTGNDTAEGINGLPMAGAFTYEDFAFPGTSGDCGNSLAAGANCIVSITFDPADLGVQLGVLAVSYDGAPDAIRPLLGGGEGQSANLLSNPGGEDAGVPPSGWTDVGNGTWVTTPNWEGVVFPNSGLLFISANTGNHSPPFRLVQSVDVSTWASTIDMGVMRFSVEGYARAWGDDNDEYRIRLHYSDGAGADLGSWSSGWDTGSSWSLVNNTAPAPVNTRAIEVELGCRKSSGSFCDAYYDDLDLHAVFP